MPDTDRSTPASGEVMPPERGVNSEEKSAGGSGPDEPRTALSVVEATSFQLAADPVEALETAERLVKHMAAKCTGPKYIAQISGRDYPKVDWWTTVGMALGIFPSVISNRRLDREGITYEAVVEVHWKGRTITRAESICSSEEPRWKTADEYAVKSMAATRATGKAFRLGLSGLAVMAGLEPTPAEEMDGVRQPRGESGGGQKPLEHCPIHDTGFLPFKKGGSGHKMESGEWCRPADAFRTCQNYIAGMLERMEQANGDPRAWLDEHFPDLKDKSNRHWTLKEAGAVYKELAAMVGKDTIPAAPAAAEEEGEGWD